MSKYIKRMEYIRIKEERSEVWHIEDAHSDRQIHLTNKNRIKLILFFGSALSALVLHCIGSAIYEWLVK